METFEEIVDEVQADLTLGDESSFIDRDRVKSVVNRAYRNKVAAIFKWPQTEDAKLTDTIAGAEYYDYPDYWRPNSIWKLVVNGIDYEDPLHFRDYQFEKDNLYPSGIKKIWSNKALQYFIIIDGAAPTTDGNPTYPDGNIEIHGQKIPAKLVADGDLTLFSLNMPELNEAIGLEAKAMLKSKGEEDQVGQFASVEAKQICVTAWKKLSQEMSKYEKTLPQFNVPNLFGKGGSQQIIGNFDRRR